MIQIKRKTQKPERAGAVAAVERSPWAPALISLLVLSLAALLALPLGATTTELEADAYGFVSRVEGEALLAGLEGDDAVEAEINHPLLTGDQITTDSGRIELVLPDGSVVRVGRGTLVVFDVLAGAPDSEVEGGSLLSLDRGELQIRTPETFFVGEDLAVRTPNATVYLGPAGSYRIDTQGSSFTEVVVRSGFAEAETRSGSGIARAGEALEISGYGRPFVNVVEAGPADSLELWAGDLDRAAYEAASADVDPRLTYAAAPLEGAGEWLAVDSGRAWRPYVRADWRPFRYGRWVYTPSGLTWVASAPWGWVTSHYGSWDYVPGYGWLWLPGNVYMPAGVYWYWGPTHVAWIPNGYYSRHYRSGFRFGVYGWAGGDWGYWADWTFCPTRYFGRRGYDRYWDSGRNLARERRFAVPRGIVTTDTRGLGPNRWGKPTELLDTLVKRVDPQGRGRNLPDVTGFVARREFAESRAQSRESGALRRETSVQERLRPLPEERNRGRFATRSVAVDTSSSVRSGSSSRRVDGATTRGRSSGIRRITPRGEAPTRVGTETGTRAGSRDASEVSQPSDRVRSVAGRRIGSEERPTRGERPSVRERGSSLDRSTGAESAPARRVLDRIRAHRETARGSSRQPQSKSKSVSKSSGSGSSKASPRSSGSSARSSGSKSSSARKSSPPSRSSSNRSSSGRSGSRSRSRPRPNN